MFRYPSFAKNVSAVAIAALLFACSGHVMTPQLPTHPSPSQALSSTSAIVHSGSFTLYKVPTVTSGVGLATGPGNTVWFPDCNSSAKLFELSANTGTVTPFSPPSQYSSANCAITNADGYFWYFSKDSSESVLDLARATPTNSFAFFDTPATTGSTNIAVGSDGRLWFVSNVAGSILTPRPSIVTSVSVSGVRGPSVQLPTRYRCSGISAYQGIAVASAVDKHLYITAHALCFAAGVAVDLAAVFKVSTSGSILGTFVLPNHAEGAYSRPVLPIVAGPDGNLWIAESGYGQIARVTPAGALTQFTVPRASPIGITAGTDGSLWFTAGNFIGRITTSGTITEYKIPFVNAVPGEIISCPPPTSTTECGPHGGVWFSDNLGIMRFDFP